MFSLVAIGFCPKQPQLKVLRQDLCKLEFEVCHKRWTRDGEVIESQTFVAWNDQAMELAEKLVPGVEIIATGRQETSRYQAGDGSTRSRTVFALTDIKIIPRRPSAPSHEGERGHVQNDRVPRPTQGRAHQGNYQQRGQSAHQGGSSAPRSMQPQYEHHSGPSTGMAQGVPPPGEFDEDGFPYQY